MCVAGVELFTHEPGEGLDAFGRDVGALAALGLDPVEGGLDNVSFVLQGLDAFFQIGVQIDHAIFDCAIEAGKLVLLFG